MMKTKNKMKFDEDIIIKEIENHILSTYSNSYHYVNKNEIQTIDVWEGLGSLQTTARDNAIKYLMRFGKKDGKNIKDLYKAIHNIMFMIYSCRNELKEKNDNQEKDQLSFDFLTNYFENEMFDYNNFMENSNYENSN